MKFNELDQQMRLFETAHDHCVLPGVYIVVRLDGRGFTKLTKEIMKFQAPFDEVFRDLMINTVRHLMDCGFNIRFGYSQSDEISLLLDPEDATFGRKERKLNSVLAGEASAKLSLLMGQHAVFDSRISQLPTLRDVTNYFRWRQEDAHRNALNAHCYWQLRSESFTPRKATREISGLSASDKNEFLFSRGTNFNEIPTWQKRGFGLYWENYQKEGYNPIKKESTQTLKRRLKIDLNLPMRDEYDLFVQQFLAPAA